MLTAIPASAGTFLVELGTNIGSPGSSSGSYDAPRVRVVNTTPGSATTPLLTSLVLTLDAGTTSTVTGVTNFGQGNYTPGIDDTPSIGNQSGNIVIAVAAAFGAYMALNIGANDVANNMGPAVGAKVLTMGGAILIAVVFETAGALIAGGDVVNTISGGIVAPEAVAAPEVFVWAMMAALVSAALWLNLATWMGAPVSTTHSIVGGVMGAGIMAAGFGAVNWATMGQIAASWV
ncbi:MAG: hypothetical protein B7Z08_09060, partial [Sphingomonadales bacterium 32-68-7]